MPFDYNTMRRIPYHILNKSINQHLRVFSTRATACLRSSSPTKPTPTPIPKTAQPTTPTLTHLTPSGTAHMVSITNKSVTSRSATAKCTVVFSPSSAAPQLIRDNAIKKGDVLGVARVAGIMAAKRTPDLIPLCHPISITHVIVDLLLEDVGEQGQGRVDITATVTCEGKTGVEMEALTAASVAALTVYDMCKSADKGMRVEDLRVVRKEGGKGGLWVEGERVGD